LKKFFTYFIVFLLILSSFPKAIGAQSAEDSLQLKQVDTTHIVVSNEENNEVALFFEESEDSEYVTIPNGSQVVLLTSGEVFSQILYIDKDTREEFTGFIDNHHLQTIQFEDPENENTQPFPQNGTKDETLTKEKEMDEDLPQENKLNEEELSQENKLDEEELLQENKLEEKENLEKKEQSIVTDNVKEKTEEINNTKAMNLTSQSTLHGIALKNPTYVYSDPSTNAKHLKSYETGTILKYSTYSENWYICTVYINGKRTTGYIHINDVETIETNQKELRGVALKANTSVYSKPATSSKPLKSYAKGTVLKYKSFSPNWYEAIVYINGKRHTGYINKIDVDTAFTEQENINGFALKNPTKIYAMPSLTSDVLKTYEVGKVLKYRSFTKEWYEATIYINGEKHTGYIHVNDVGETIEGPTINGIAITNVKVYEEMSRSSRVLKDYPQGKVLKYSVHAINWYKATVYIDGKPHTGYIHVDDVEDISSNQKEVRGIAKLNATPVYDLASTNAKVLKTYSKGSILKYRTLSNNWYEATVYINGKWHTGYIYKNDVETSVSPQKTLQGVAKNKVNVYSKANTSSNVLKSYAKDQVLKVRTFTSDWFEATIYVEGKKKTGYIYKNDLNTGIYNKVIVLDAGHGGYDGGASGNGIIEKQLNLDVTLALKEKLENAGAIVHLTRSSDVYISLDERAALSKKVGADIFVSIHANSATPSAHGAETYYSGQPYNGETNPFPTESMLLATYIQNHLVSETNMYDRNAKHGGYIVLRRNSVPSALVELGFITNASDAAKMKQSNYKYQAAEGIYKGILEYFK
jgi:N-acetylmuramoyl-L-alanine amidase